MTSHRNNNCLRYVSPLFEFYEFFKGTLWLARMMKLDVVRQAAIPPDDGDAKKDSAPMRIPRLRDRAVG